MRKFILLIILIAQYFNVPAQNWLPIGNGSIYIHNGGVTLKTFNGKLIAGGDFSMAVNTLSNGVAMWDGTNWSVIDTAMNSFNAVRPLIIFQGYLYGFVSPNNNDPGFMMRLDSSFKWHVVSNSNYTLNTQTATIYTACVYNNELYVGGSFDRIGNINANHIAKWDGTTWSPLGGGIDQEYVFGMKVYNNELYVGGEFHLVDNVLPVNNLARWIGNYWSDVGGGITPNGIGISFKTMEVYNNELYIGGHFENAGGVPMKHITKWNGNAFSDVGGGLGFAGPPFALKVFGNRLILGGYFDPGLFQNQAGTWDGFNFDSLGTGIDAGPTDFEIYDCKLYAGGSFYGAGVVYGVAELDTSVCTTAINEINYPDYLFSIYPNPCSFQTTILFDQEKKNLEIKLIDVLGKEIKKIKFNGKQYVLETGTISAGIYFVQTTDEKKNVINKKIIIQ